MLLDVYWDIIESVTWKENEVMHIHYPNICCSNLEFKKCSTEKLLILNVTFLLTRSDISYRESSFFAQ